MPDLAQWYPSMHQAAPEPRQDHPQPTPASGDDLSAVYPSMNRQRAPITVNPAPTQEPVQTASTSTEPKADASAPQVPQSEQSKAPEVEDLTEVYKSMRSPNQAFAGDLEVPDSIDPESEILADFKSMAQQAGLDAQTGSEMLNLHTQANEQYWADLDRRTIERNEAWVSELKQSGEYETLREDARAAIARGGENGQQVAQHLKALGVANHPGLARLLAGLERRIRELER